MDSYRAKLTSKISDQKNDMVHPKNILKNIEKNKIMGDESDMNNIFVNMVIRINRFANINGICFLNYVILYDIMLDYCL
jgi:hypothetical protein